MKYLIFRTIFILLFSSALLFTMFIFNMGYSRAEDITKIIAKVNDQIITSKDLDDYCNSLNLRLSDEENSISQTDNNFKRKALDRYIEDKLVLDEAKREGIKISEPVIESRIERMIASYGSRDKFEEDLIERGLNISILREKIREQYLMREIIDRYVKSRVNVAPQEISSYYNENTDKFYSPQVYIFYMAKSSDNIVLKEISKVIDQDGISKAQEKYADTLIKIESTKEELREDISAFLQSLVPGKHGIRKVDDSFYLIYFESTIKPDLLPLIEVKEGIYQYLWNKKFKIIFDNWLKELKEKAVIKNYYE